MTIILTTTEGLQTHRNVVVLQEFESSYLLDFFDPRTSPIEVDKDKVLLIQVTK